MHVSYVELKEHCKKVFRAKGIPVGCDEDGADVVAWGEFIGLSALAALYEEVTEMQYTGMTGIKEVGRDKDKVIFDANNQSALVLGKLMADYALGEIQSKKHIKVHVTNTTRSRLLAYPAYYVSNNNQGCIIFYRINGGLERWIFAAPEIEFPVFAEGHEVEETILSVLQQKVHYIPDKEMADQEFLLICTEDTSIVTSCIRKLRNEVENKQIEMTEASRLRAEYQRSMFYGKEIDSQLWEKLKIIGQGTLVEATEESRQRGAG